MTYRQSYRTRAAGLLLPLLALFLVIRPIEALATTWNVSPSSSGACTIADPNCNTIQGAINGASTGETINVFPGTYSETATAPSPPACSGDTVGLYIGTSGIIIQGVDGGGTAITDPMLVQATVNTNSNLCFGPDGFFVTGDNVTIAGIHVGTNTNPNPYPGQGSQNKTIEIWGDNFTLKNCDIADLQGSVYFNDANFDTVHNVSHLQTYRIDGNIFEDGVSLDITNGAGFSGLPSGRVITGNMFTTSSSPSRATISFSGSDTGVPWYVYSVGGAVITGNTFSNSAPDGQLIRARGTYDNAQFDWASYWSANTFNKAAVVGASPPAGLETYSYPNSYGTFSNVRRIGATIQGEVDHALAHDTVLVAAGTYVEQLTINASLTVTGAGAGATVVQAPAVLAADASGFKNIITIGGAANAEVSDLTVTGPGPGPCGSLNTGIFVRDGAQANIHDNTIANISDNPLSGCQNGQGIFVGRKLFGTTGSATIANNFIFGYQKGGIVVDNAGSTATITGGNTITGVGATAWIAQNGIQISRGAAATVSGNTVSGNLCNYSSCGADPVNNDQSVGVLLYQAGAGTLVSGNTVTDNDVGVYNLADGSTIHGNALASNRYEGIFLDQGSATVDMNDIQDGNIGVIAVSFSGSAENATGTLTCNRITGATTAGISLIDQNATDAFVPTITAHSNAIAGNGLGLDGSDVLAGPALDARNNYWGCAGGPGTAGCDTAIGNLQVVPFATALPPCVYCSANSECNDGLACNGVETCNLGTNTCQAGTPVPCSYLNDSCNTGTCSEPSGDCVATQKPDGTSCAGGGSCQAGVCSGSPSSLIVAAARLKRNTAKNPKLANGSVSVQAIIVDEDTGGTLLDNLQNKLVTLDVQDGSGNFYSLQPIVSFSSCTPNKAKTRVSCKGDKASKITATFAKIRYFGHPYGEVWKMTMNRTGGLVTGSGSPTGPIHVTLHQGLVDRSDSPNVCSSLGLNKKTGVWNTMVCYHAN